MLRRPCDVFIPCAVDATVNRQTAPHVQAKLVIEAAHGSITANANKILEERGITVVPDLLATGGGAIVNYFEWVQNPRGYTWSLERVQKRMARMLDDAWTEMALIASDQRGVAADGGAHARGQARGAGGSGARAVRLRSHANRPAASSSVAPSRPLREGTTPSTWIRVSPATPPASAPTASHTAVDGRESFSFRYSQTDCHR
jgi:hypothetical protein